MTTEVAIINRAGIALAADSAVTVGRERVWKTTNKLFSLSPINDIGIMVYGNADFIGYPWDTIIKEFRRTKEHIAFPTVEDAADAFFKFLQTDIFQDEQAQLLSFWLFFLNVAEDLKSAITYEGDKKIEYRKAFKKACKFYSERFTSMDPCLDIKKTTFINKYRDVCIDLFKDIFKITFTKTMEEAALELCYEALRRPISSAYSTGVVFAGFGRDELLPHIRDYSLDGRHQANLRCWCERSRNLNTANERSGAIMPFGQADIAYLFMEGTSVGQEQYVEETLREILRAKSTDLVKSYVADPDARIVEDRLQSSDDDKIVKKFIEEYHNYRKQTVVQPVMQVVATLPKEEMAAMAESLVDITGLRRKVDSRIESVSGPIDVAFISKGDGFIWMKRKHYFDIHLNGDFRSRKARQLGDLK